MDFRPHFKIESEAPPEKTSVDMNAPISPTLLSSNSRHSKLEEELRMIYRGNNLHTRAGEVIVNPVNIREDTKSLKVISLNLILPKKILLFFLQYLKFYDLFKYNQYMFIFMYNL
jgi:hypothetical protein